MKELKENAFSGTLLENDTPSKGIDWFRNIMSYLPVIGLLCLSSSILFPYGWYQRISLYIIAVSYPLDYVCNLRWKEWQWNNNKIVYILFISFFLLIPIWQLFDSQHTPILQHTIEKYLPFLLIGICGIMGMTDKFRIEYVVFVMLLTSVGTIIYILTLTGWPRIGSLDHWVAVFNYKSHEYVNTHMVLNLYWNLSIILGLFFVWRSRSQTMWKSIISCLMIPVCVALCITDGRTGLLTFIGIVLIVMCYCMFVYRKWWMIGVMLGVIISSSALLVQHERFVKVTTETNPRIYIWKTTVDMIKEKPLLGYGVCSARAEFVERGMNDEDFYDKYANPLALFLKTKGKKFNTSIMHPHNAFLETWIQFGIIGIILLLGSLIFPLTMRLKKNQLFLNLCVFAFFMQSLFESMGSDLQPMYFCLMVLLWNFHSINTSKKDVKIKLT